MKRPTILCNDYSCHIFDSIADMLVYVLSYQDSLVEYLSRPRDFGALVMSASSNEMSSSRLCFRVTIVTITF